MEFNSIKPDMSFIPESVSINDMAIFTERSIQDTFNNFQIDIFSEEVINFRKLTNIYNEENDIVRYGHYNVVSNEKSLGEKIKQFFIKLVEKIKGFFANILKKVKEFAANIKKKYNDKYIKRFRDSVLIIQKTNTKFEKIPCISIDDAKEYLKSTNIIYDKINKIVDNIKSIDSENDPKFEDYGDNEKILSIIGLSESSIKDGHIFNYYFAKNHKRSMGEGINDAIRLFKHYYTIDEIDKYKDTIPNLALNNNNWVQKIKRQYDGTLKDIKELKKATEKKIKEERKDSNKNIFFTRYLSLVSNISKIMTKVVATDITSMQNMQNVFLNLMSRTIQYVYTGEKIKDAFLQYIEMQHI